MTCWRCSISRVVVVALLVLGAIPAAAQPEESIEALRERARRIVERGSLQSELPAPQPRKPLDMTPIAPPDPSPLSWLSGLTLVLIGVAGVGLLGVWLSERIGPAVPRDVALSGEQGSAAPQRFSLEEADGLAAAGQTAEALHALLLVTIDALVRRAELTLPPAITARELPAELDLDESAAKAYLRLVRLVELVWFGGRRPRPEHYTGARVDALALIDGR